MAKVYCKDCKWFILGEPIPYSFGPPDHIKNRCIAPQNFQDSNVEPSIVPISQPHIINRFNDCIWYEPIESQSSSSSSGDTDIDPIDYTYWTWRLVVLTESASGNDSTYVLPMVPKDENFILPFINGVQTEQFSYDKDSCSITFTDGNVPAEYKVTVFMLVKRSQIQREGSFEPEQRSREINIDINKLIDELKRNNEKSNNLLEKSKQILTQINQINNGD